MTWKTHLIGGLQAGVLLSGAIGEGPVTSAMMIGCAALGSVLPDIDYTAGKLAKSDGLVGLASGFLSRVTKHRGFTHTIPGAFAMSAVFYVLAMFRTERESVAAFFAALAAFLVLHIMGDAVRWLAGWIAAGVYVFGPGAAEVLADKGLGFDINARSAALCAAGIFAGCIVHDVYDTFNKNGVEWLWPIAGKRFHIMKIRTRSSGERCFAAVQVLILAVIIAALFQGRSVAEILAL